MAGVHSGRDLAETDGFVCGATVHAIGWPSNLADRAETPPIRQRAVLDLVLLLVQQTGPTHPPTSP